MTKQALRVPDRRRLFEECARHEWIEFVCPKHGFLVATVPTATVTCVCGRKARVEVNGTRLSSRDLDRMRKSLQKPLQKPGLVSAESPLAARNAENGEWAVSEYDWPQKPLDGNWRSTRARTLQRDRYRCQRCNVRKPAVELDAHHVLPRAEGGRDTLWNLIALCEPCHDFVEVQDPPLRNRAQIVGSWVPVERDAAA